MFYFFTYGSDHNVINLFPTSNQPADVQRRQQARWRPEAKGSYGPYEAENAGDAAVKAAAVLDAIRNRTSRDLEQ